jgi:hypothetical protein
MMLNLMTEQSCATHHNHIAQYIESGVVVMRRRGVQQRRQQQLTYLQLQYQYCIVETMA